MNASSYIKILSEKLTERRFEHSLAVAIEAQRLAVKYGADAEKAKIAGLLHDIMKDSEPNIQLQTVEFSDIIMTSLEKREVKLWHAMAGAAFVKGTLHIDDVEIINAIRYHTTARANMSILEKVLYLADYTSSDRDYPGVDSMRLAVDISMEHAMREAFIFSIADLANRGKTIHPDTVDAYNEVILAFEQ